MPEALVQLDTSKADAVDRVIGTIDRLGGRALHTYPPHAILALLPSSGRDELVRHADVASVDTEAIIGERLARAEGAVAGIIEAWNRHLADARRRVGRPSEGLAWDQEGLSPPDGPPEVRERLRRRERELYDDDQA
jgi:hypothetical protein